MAIEWIEKDGKRVAQLKFQPKLEDGTPIGGEQVVQAEDQGDVQKTLELLLDKQKDNYENLYRRNRDLMREQELKGTGNAAPAPRLKPRALTTAEKLAFVKGINDPEKLDETLELAFEAKFGARSDVLSQRIDSADVNNEELRMVEEAKAWALDHPELAPVLEITKNQADICRWIASHGLKFRYENFDKAYAALAALLEQPTQGTGNPPKPENKAPEAALPQPPSVPSAPVNPSIPTSTPRSHSGAGSEVPTDQLTRKMIWDMAGTEEYKRRMKDPAFFKKANEAFTSK